MKSLLLTFTLAVNSALLFAQDGLPLNRGWRNYAMDESVGGGTDMMVARWLSVKSTGFGPLGSSRYQGEIQIIHRLYGQCPEETNCSFKVWTVPKPGVKMKVPVPGDMCVMIGSYRAEQKKIDARRFIEPTTANLELVGSLIREYKSKELAASPAASATLDQGLALALKEALRHEKPPEPPSKTAPEFSTSSNKRIAAWAGLALVLLAVAVAFWKKHW